MSIRTKEYCDICEADLGEEHKDALIIKPKGKPAFAQLIWTYYKKGLQIFKKQDGSEEPVLYDGWMGQPNRLEFCDKHASQFNALLKSFCKRHYKLIQILDEIETRDRIEWSSNQRLKEDTYKTLHKEWLEKRKKDGS